MKTKKNSYLQKNTEIKCIKFIKITKKCFL